jgi:sulfite reductase alpha subunit-like flavoprotein
VLKVLTVCYREELAEYVQAGTLTHLGLAVSRDETAEFKHVQDAMMANASSIAKYVCLGDSIWHCLYGSKLDYYML